MADGLAIVRQFDEAYNEAYYAWNPWYPLAARDLRFYQGDQWDEKERQKLFNENRNAFVFNRIRSNINLITGYQRKHRLSSVVAPIENSDQATADQLSQLLLYVLNASDGYRTISDCFGGAVKTGWNLATVWMDFRDDPVNGDIKIGREPYSGFITDPYFMRLDWSDCGYVLRRKYLPVENAASLLPGQEKDVYALQRLGWSRDDKFTWLPYQRQPNTQEYMAFSEMYEQKWKNVPMLVDMETGEFFEWDASPERFQMLRQVYPQLEIVKRPKRYIERHILINDEYMKTEVNPYGLDEYPMAPFVGQFDPESEFWELKVQSLVRCQIDPQREANRRRSQMTDIVDSQINSGYIADDDSVINPRSLFQSSQGKVIWRKKDSRPGAIEKIPPAQIPPSMFQLQELFDRDMRDILGVNDASFGEVQSGNESGLMMMIRQGQSIVNLQDVFDNLRFSQKMLCQKIVKLIQTWSPEKIERIINQKPTEQFYSKEFTKYDITVQEGVLTDTQKQVYFRQLVDLKQITDAPSQGPITPEMLVEAAPMQGKTTLLKEIAENREQAAKMAQAQQQAQQALQNAQKQAYEASTIEKLAGAKERFTRSVANMGLEDERASKAIEDRAMATLDRIKAAKELVGIDQEQFLKALQIVQILDERSAQKEQQIKQDDVNLSARADQAAVPSSNPAQGQSFEQPVTQRMEVPNG
jgi:hypothetical protein